MDFSKILQVKVEEDESCAQTQRGSLLENVVQLVAA